MSAKRPHERGPSLSLRPHKSVKVYEHGDSISPVDDELMTIDDSGTVTTDTVDTSSSTLWNKLQMISASDPLVIPPLQFLGRSVRPLTTFDISGITAWPSSLGVVRNQFYYNLTPQDTHVLPTNVLNLTAWRRMAAASSEGSPNPPTRAPYFHLGFTEWLKLDVYVFLPRLSLEHCVDENPGRPTEAVLEAWTDRVFLPAMYDGDPRAPTSWARSKENRTSTLWFNTSIAPYPTYKIFTGAELDTIWGKVRANSDAISEFRDVFLVLHSEKRHSGTFTGSNPEMVFRDFEKAWMQEIDTRYIELGKDSLKLSVSCDIAA